MKKTFYFDRLIESREFRLDRLFLEGIDNSYLLGLDRPDITVEQTALFHRDVSCGDDYLDRMHDFVSQSIKHRRAAPVVRFADGEYAFYAQSLRCNGLYQQAESVAAIRNALPMHVQALEVLQRNGKLAPLISPGNTQLPKKRWLSVLRKSKFDAGALDFLQFLSEHQVRISPDNYLPFYIVYAYLTSARFLRMLDGKHLCVVSSECDLAACRQWFARLDSFPRIDFIKIPESYVATRWQSVKEETFERISGDADICLAGAGIGSLVVCVDVARHFSIPAIDAGHVLNMMNGRVDKSKGARLYTLWETDARPADRERP